MKKIKCIALSAVVLCALMLTSADVAAQKLNIDSPINAAKKEQMIKARLAGEAVKKQETQQAKNTKKASNVVVRKAVAPSASNSKATLKLKKATALSAAQKNTAPTSSVKIKTPSVAEQKKALQNRLNAVNASDMPEAKKAALRTKIQNRLNSLK